MRYLLGLLALVGAFFFPATPATAQSCPVAGINAPGAADPWGGCFPGWQNTGVPAGTALVNVDDGAHNPPSPALLPDNTGWSYSVSNGYISVTSPNAVIDGISDTQGVYVPAGDSLTIENSRTGGVNDEGASLTVLDSKLNGGKQIEFSAITGGTNITVKNSNLIGGQHEVLCYGNCDVENSYLHKNFNGAALGDHQNGFLAVSGDNITLIHNSVGCVGGCTADIGLLDQNENSNALIENNLLLYAPDAAFCAYPGPDLAGGNASYIVWQDNVFQRGANGKCATYGPVSAWNPGDGPGNVWTGNTWDDGTALAP